MVANRQSAADGCCLPNPNRVDEGLPARNPWVMTQQVAHFCSSNDVGCNADAWWWINRGFLISRSENLDWNSVCVCVLDNSCLCTEEVLLRQLWTTLGWNWNVSNPPPPSWLPPKKDGNTSLLCRYEANLLPTFNYSLISKHTANCFS